MLIAFNSITPYVAAILLQSAPPDSGFVQFITDNILAVVAGVGAVVVIFIIYLIRGRGGRDDVFKL